MAKEITVQSSLTIRDGSLVYQSLPQAFVGNLEIAQGVGPTPGLITVPEAGVDIDLSALDNPSIGRVMNLLPAGNTTYIEVGIHDGSLFHPILEVWPGESYILRLARNLGVEEDVPGTGTSAVVNTLHSCSKAGGGSAPSLFEFFDR